MSASQDKVKTAEPAAQKTTRPRKERKPKGQKPESAKPRFQAKLMIEENEEGKTCLIKITRNTGTRQIINYALSKIKTDFKVEMNAFSLDMAKAIEATEIMKTRAPFLHQETKLIQSSKTTENKSTDA